MAKSNVGCFKHPDEKVVGSCSKCGKFMCKACMDKYESHLCEDCEKKRKEENQKKQDAKKAQLQKNAGELKSEALKSLIIGAVVSLIFGFVGYSLGKSDGNGLMMGYMLAGFPWGYKLISKIIDDGVLFFAALAGNLLIAYIIKFVLGMLIGAIAWPISIGYRIYKYVKADSLHKETKKL